MLGLILTMLVFAPGAAIAGAITLGTGFALTGATIITPGTISQSSTPDELLVRDVQKELYVSEPHKGGLWIFLARSAQGRKPIAEKHEWTEDEEIPINAVATADVAAGLAGATVSWTNALSRYDIVTPEDHLYHPTTGQIVRVLTRSDTSVDVVRVDSGAENAYGAVQALTTGDGLINMGKIREEGHTVVPGVGTMPVVKYNYVEEVSDEIKITARRKHTRSYSDDDWTRTYDRKVYEWMTKQNIRLWTGKRRKIVRTEGGVNKNTTYTGGILDTQVHPFSRSIDFPIATFNHTHITELFRLLKTHGGAYRRVLFMDSKLQTLFTNLDRDKVRFRGMVSKKYEIGLHELVDTTSGHSIMLVHEPAFDKLAENTPSFEYYGVLLDMKLVRRHPFIPMRVETVDNFVVNGETTTVKRWHEGSTLVRKGDKEHIIITAS